MFISPDSLIANIFNPQNLNHYSYVLNNPFKYIDPDGRDVYRVDRGIRNPFPYTGDILVLKAASAVTGAITNRFSHAYFDIIPDNPEDFGGQTNFQLGAYPSTGNIFRGGTLTYKENYEKQGTTIYNRELINTPQGKTDTEHIRSIMAEGNKLNDANVPYFLLPTVGGSSANSNVFISTTLYNTGGSSVAGDLARGAISPGIGKTYNYDKGSIEKQENKDKSTIGNVIKRFFNSFTSSNSGRNK